MGGPERVADAGIVSMVKTSAARREGTGHRQQVGIGCSLQELAANRNPLAIRRDGK
jgi:hypothetical protein